MSRVWAALRHHPSGVLLIGQLLVVLAYPFLDGSTGGRAVLGVVQMIVVFAAVAAVRLTPALSWVALLLGVPAMVFAVLEAVEPDTDWIVLTSAVVHAPFYFYVSYAMIRYLFHDDRVTRDELFATGCRLHRRRVGVRLRVRRGTGDLAGLLRRRGRQRPGVVQPALPVLHEPDQRRPLRRRCRSTRTPARW